MTKTFSLPQGVKDFGPQQAEELRRVEDVILEEFSRWGYKRVITPLFEYHDTITIGLGEDLKSKVMKFIDPSTGKLLPSGLILHPRLGGSSRPSLSLTAHTSGFATTAGL